MTSTCISTSDQEPCTQPTTPAKTIPTSSNNLISLEGTVINDHTLHYQNDLHFSPNCNQTITSTIPCFASTHSPTNSTLQPRILSNTRDPYTHTTPATKGSHHTPLRVNTHSRKFEPTNTKLPSLSSKQQSTSQKNIAIDENKTLVHLQLTSLLRHALTFLRPIKNLERNQPHPIKQSPQATFIHSLYLSQWHLHTTTNGN